jgi:hypothetical protein
VQQALAITGLRFFTEAELRSACERVGLQITRYLSFGTIVFVQALKVSA